MELKRSRSPCLPPSCVLPLLFFLAGTAQAAPKASPSPKAVPVTAAPSGTPSAPVAVPPVQVTTPSGKTFASESGLDFRWLPYQSPYVKEYELTLYKLSANGGAPTLLNRMSLPYDSDRTSKLAGVLFPGLYAWKIEAKDERGGVVARGGARFLVVPETRRFRALIGVNFFRTAYLGTNAVGVVDAPNVDVNGFSGGMEYYFNSKWRAIFDMKVSTLKFAGQSLPFNAFSLGAIRRHAIGSARRWHSYFGARLQKDSLPELTAFSTYPPTYRLSKVSRLEFFPIVGAEYQIAPPVLAYSQLELSKNLSLSGGDYGAMTENRSSMGYRITIGFQGNLTGPLGYDANIIYFKDGFSYSTNNASPDLTFSGYDMRLAFTYLF